MLTKELLDAILSQYPLSRGGPHGVAHWARVLENGRRLATETEACLAVVELFALFHDSQRFGEGDDPAHGLRGAELAAAFHGTYYDLPPEEFELLFTACEQHTEGLTDGDITLQTCWDADRLDLGRVGIMPMPSRLCTDAAKTPDILVWAIERSHDGHAPALASLL